MLRKRIVLVLACAGIVGGCWLAQAFSQQGQDQPRQPGGEARQRDRTQRMAQFRQRMQERMREQLGASEEEWKVLQPRIEKISQAIALKIETQGGYNDCNPGSEHEPGSHRHKASSVGKQAAETRFRGFDSHPQKTQGRFNNYCTCKNHGGLYNYG